jgi:phosphatidylserine decarboxylase
MKQPVITEYFKTLPQYLLPQHLLSRLMFAVMRIRFAPWKNWQINWFIGRYGVDMTIAEKSKPTCYPHFNSFFTRALRPDARSVVRESGAITCPVDGAVSQLGDIRNEYLFQAKDRYYSLSQLLANDAQLMALFAGGKFITLYLAPRDYHRIHMPLDGRLTRMTYVPGRLFAVNPRTTRVVQNLFARNERVISLFETEVGPMALIMVGAIFVGSMETVWAGRLTPAKARNIRGWEYDQLNTPPILLSKGAEMGRFNMGSTVILLFGPDTICWSPNLEPGIIVQTGQRIGTVISGQ